MNAIRLIGAGALLWSAAQTASARDTMDPLGTMNAFQGALSTSDAALAKSLLAPDVLIYESGGQESSRDEYASHHMKGDMAFLAKSKINRLSQASGVHGDLAWVTTRSRIIGTSKDQPVDVFSTESAVLKRMPAGWRIVHIHWSSRSASKDRRAPGQ